MALRNSFDPLREQIGPVQIHSAHRLSHPGLHAAVERFIVDEREAVEEALPQIAEHVPFRKGAAPDLPQVAGIDLPRE